MRYSKWLTTTITLLVIFTVTIVAINSCIDHHAVRVSLFSNHEKAGQIIYPIGFNQHMFHPAYVYKNSNRFDSFLFGSSRVGVIDVTKIPTGKFYNMSYSLGVPAQHLAILKYFLKKGIKIKSVIIGLDEISFVSKGAKNEQDLLRIMHPDIGGPDRLKIFGMYFFRPPELSEIGQWWDRVILGIVKGQIVMSSEGINLGFRERDKSIEREEKPIFNFTVKTYKPVIYPTKSSNAAFIILSELVALANTYHFSITFFINPLYAQLYINEAESLFLAKARLAQLTDYYDFSGFNSVTTNPLNYYESSHYRYRVGDLIVERIFGGGSVPVPDDFGVHVTKQNVGRHLEIQKQELEQYLRTHHLK